jgi:hypothetical protein
MLLRIGAIRQADSLAIKQIDHLGLPETGGGLDCFRAMLRARQMRTVGALKTA